MFMFSDLVDKTQNLKTALKQGCTNFPRMFELPQHSRHQKDDMKEVPYLGSTNIRCHHVKFCCHSDLAPGICAPLAHTK